MAESQPALRAGPVHPSDALRSLFRLRRALTRHMPEQRDELSPNAHDVSLVFLEEVETSLGIALPDDVIVLATLRVPAFVTAVGLRLDHLTHVLRDCAGDFGPPRGWCAVASFGKEGIGHDTLLAISRHATRAGDPEVRTLDEPGPSELSTLSTLIRERLKKRYGRTTERWTAAVEEARADTSDDDECIVRIVDDHPPPPGPAKRVVHAKFGEGTVLRELEGKLEIAFDGGETKTLQRSFVREVGAVTVVHEGRGGYVEVAGRRYDIEHIEGGRFSIHFPSGHRERKRASDLEALEALCRSEPEKWSLERHDR